MYAVLNTICGVWTTGVPSKILFKKQKGDLITLYVKERNTQFFTHERGCVKPREENEMRTLSS